MLANPRPQGRSWGETQTRKGVVGEQTPNRKRLCWQIHTLKGDVEEPTRNPKTEMLARANPKSQKGMSAKPHHKRMLGSQPKPEKEMLARANPKPQNGMLGKTAP